MAEVFLVPQLYNARRFAVGLAPFPRLLAIEARCADLDAFVRAHPDRQPDAPPAQG
jgi:maleylpyruvate isomerase